MRNKQFKLFQCCIPVKGVKNGIIIDFQRNAFHNVSNQIIDLLDDYCNKDIYALFNDFRNSKTILKKHIRYFIENELIIISDDISCYPALNNDFSSPEIIETFSIEIYDFNTNFENFFKIQMNEVGATSLKLIIRKNEIINFNKILTLLKISKIRCVVVYFEYSMEIVKEIKPLVIDDPRISQVVFYNFKGEVNLEDCDEKFCFEKSSFEIIFDNKSIESVDDFVLNFNMYNEALHRNLMFNKSVYIDSLGNIKKHKEDLEIYGNIASTNLVNIPENKDFKSFWEITKDKIEVCKSCEFRYVCPDGKIPFKSNSKDPYYKYKTRCKYDPYQGSWDI